MRILVVKLSAIGDVIHSLPVLAALKAGLPEATVDWVVGEAAAPLLQGHPMLERVLVYPRRELGRLVSTPWLLHRALLCMAVFSRSLRQVSYDVVVDLQGLFKSALVTALARSGRKTGFSGGREFSSLVLNDRLPPYDPDEHAVDRYLKLAKAVTGHSFAPSFPVPVGENHLRGAGSLLGGASERGYICLVPGTKWETKQWTAEGFAMVAQLVRDRLGMVPVVVGGGGDRLLASAICNAAVKGVVDLTGKTDLLTLAAVFKGAKAVVSTDTGPMHLAAAMETPVVALFGPTAPWRTGPYGDSHRVLRLGLECSPCFRRQCDNRRCMKGLEARDVFEALHGVLTC